MSGSAKHVQTISERAPQKASNKKFKKKERLTYNE
jgi:hypothetical protein